MKRKYLILAAACSFLLIAGICYSFVYKNTASSATVQDLSQQQEESLSGMLSQDNSVKNLTGELNQDNSEEVLAEASSQDNNEKSPTGALGQDNLEKNLTRAPIKTLEQETSENCYVHICGAVNSPGVYSVRKDCRVVDLVNQAGGFTDEAAEDYINQALKVQDGQRIYIPTQKEVKELSAEDYMAGEASGMSEQSSPEPAGPKLININTATAEELMELPGVGEAKAASILEYRNTKGKFKTIQDLMKISGIKEGLFNKVSGYITVK